MLSAVQPMILSALFLVKMIATPVLYRHVPRHDGEHSRSTAVDSGLRNRWRRGAGARVARVLYIRIGLKRVIILRLRGGMRLSAMSKGLGGRVWLLQRWRL